MRNKRTLFAAILLLLFQGWGVTQTSNTLPRSTPEAEGISSEAITRFLDAFGKSNHELHSFMLLRHGNVVAEGWSNPYRADLKHTMYSCSKSFTATAVGFAVSEGRLTVDDKVISFFPNDLPMNVSANLAALRIRDLLSMSVGQDPDPSFGAVSRDTDWVKAFLATPVLNPPGTKFLYNSVATYMLSAIVQKVTGQKVLDYLSPRLFQPLGITGIDWETDPHGINVGGWGLRLKTEDMARFAQLFLQKGKWNGKQILPAAWVEEATTLKIVQHPDLPQAKKDSSDWEQGYCYQMWRSRHNSYRGDGAYGQFIIVLPEKDAVFVLTSESQNMQDEFNYIWQYLYPAIQPEKLPENKQALAALKQKIAALAIPLPAKTTATPQLKDISGKTFSVSPNDMSIQKISFQFKGNSCNVGLTINEETYPFSFGSGKWTFGQTAKPPPALTRLAQHYYVGLPASKVAGAYRWKDANTLELTLRYLESPHAEMYTCHFEKYSVSVDYHTSNDNKTQVLKGVLMQSAH